MQKPSEYFMLEELTTDLVQVLNKYHPKMGCDYTDIIDEQTVKHTLNMIQTITQTNLNTIYPQRHE